MSNKSPTITAGPASNNDGYSTTEEALVSGALIFDVLANDSRRGTLHSLDSDTVADLLNPDSVLLTEPSRLGAAIWITADGRVGYAMDPAQAQSLAAGETIVDSFVYASRMPNGSLVWSTVQVSVTGSNDAPVAAADAGAADEDALVTGSVASNDQDVDHGAVLSFAATGPLPAGFTLASDGRWTLDAAHAAYQSLRAGETTSLAINYTVTDQHGASSASVLTLVVTGRNDVPVAAADFGETGEDAFVNGSVAGNDADADSGAVLSYAVDGPVPTGFFMAADGHWAFDGFGAEWQSLAAGETAQLVIPYTVTDEHGATAHATLTLVVVGANDVPTAWNDFAGAEEDSTASGSVAGNDGDIDNGSMLTFAPVGDLPAGFAMAADGSWTFDGADPAWQSLFPGESVELVIGYRVTDEAGASSEATLTLTVTGTNDAPVAVPDFDFGYEGFQTGGSVYWNDVDPDAGAWLYFEATGELPAGFVLSSDGSWWFDGSDPAYDALAAGETLELVIPYIVYDDLWATSESTLTLFVSGGNDAPVAQDDHALVGQASVVSGSVADNDFDPDHGAQLSYRVADPDYPPFPGEEIVPPGFVLNSDGSWTFDAAEFRFLTAGETFVTEVEYVVTDEHGEESFATLYLEVIGANDAPEVLGEWQDPYMLEGDPGVVGQMLVFDPDWTDVLVASVERLGEGPALGTIVIDSFAPDPWDHTGEAILSWHFEPGPELESLDEGDYVLEEFAFTIDDGQGGTTTHSILVGLVGMGDDPVATAASADVLEDAFFEGLLTPYASDVDRYSWLTFTTDTPQPGFTLYEDGYWTLDASDPAYEGLAAGETVTFDIAYTVTDPTGRTASSTLTITLHGADDTVAPPPVYTGSGDPNDHDALVGGPANNAASIFGNDSTDTITGGPAAQSIDGLGGDDTIYGGAGDDHLHGNGGNDIVYGQAGADWLKTGWGIDTLYGGSGDDTLRSQTPEQEALTGTWPATLYGGSGADVLIGGGNNDLLVGGYGADTMTGGGGLDTFAFGSVLDSGDTITDFQYDVDTLDFTAIDADVEAPGNQAFGWSHDGPAMFSLWAVHEGADTIILGDTDGDLSAAEFMLTLQGTFLFVDPGLPPSDFLL